MAVRGNRRTAECATVDWGQLARYTFDSPVLEREIIDLFLQQLPLIVARLKAAREEAAWRLAVHTLKGSAAAVGAAQINAIAAGLEELGFAGDRASRAEVVAALQLAIGLYQKAVDPLFA